LGWHILQTNAEGVRSGSVQISRFIAGSLLIKPRFGSVALHDERGSLSSVYVKDIDLLIVGPISDRLSGNRLEIVKAEAEP
jgi:hypothetical protein